VVQRYKNFIFAKKNLKNFYRMKNIIFDLGGVLIDLQADKTIKCFGKNITAFYNKGEDKLFIEIAHKFERAEISADIFRQKVCEIYNLNFSDEKFDYCWNAMIGEMTNKRTVLLQNLRKKYRIFLLSNTNEIHYRFFTAQKYWNENLFERVYFSHLLGMRKPEHRIFNFVLSENNLLPTETLFFDDNAENVEVAKELGINAIQVTSEIIDLCNNINL